MISCCYDDCPSPKVTIGGFLALDYQLKYSQRNKSYGSEQDCSQLEYSYNDRDPNAGSCIDSERDGS